MLDKVKTLSEYAEISRMAADRAERFGPLDAEIIANGNGEPHGNWWVTTTLPNHECIAAAHLIARRFGVYVPQFQTTAVIRGHTREFTRNMLPGYIFVFVWGIERHFRRIMACPGITGMLPRVVPDQLIDKLRGVENKINPEYCVDTVIKYRKRRKKRHEFKVTERTLIAQEDIVSVHAKSYWSEDFCALPPEQRVSLFEKALCIS